MINDVEVDVLIILMKFYVIFVFEYVFIRKGFVCKVMIWIGLNFEFVINFLKFVI